MSTETLTLKLAVCPSLYFSHRQLALPYQRVARLESQFDQGVDLPDAETSTEETEIVLPKTSAARLMGAGYSPALEAGKIFITKFDIGGGNIFIQMFFAKGAGDHQHYRRPLE